MAQITIQLAGRRTYRAFDLEGRAGKYDAVAAGSDSEPDDIVQDIEVELQVVVKRFVIPEKMRFQFFAILNDGVKSE